jgi:hypothetical protein
MPIVSERKQSNYRWNTSLAAVLAFLSCAASCAALLSLTPPSTMSARVTFKSGKSKVTDGPFTEAKEVVGGYRVIEVKSREEALEWASRIPGGKRNGRSSPDV